MATQQRNNTKEKVEALRTKEAKEVWHSVREKTFTDK
jgi:hypothetical protein